MSELQYYLNPKYQLFPVESGGVVLCSERGTTVIESGLAGELLGLLAKGPQPVQTLLSYCIETGNLGQLWRTLAQLEGAGFIMQQEESSLSVAQAAFWEELGYSSRKMTTLLRTHALEIIELGEEGQGIAHQIAVESGWRIKPGARVKLVVTSDYLHPDLEALNAQFKAEKTPWLLVRISGSTPLIGPLFTPETACWKCLEHRFRLHHQNLYLVQGANQDQHIQPIASHPAATYQTLAVANLQLLDWLYHGEHSKLESGLLSIDVRTGQQQHHHLVKRPQCPCCGDPELPTQFPEPVTLEEVGILPEVAGGYRSATPEETLEKYAYHISPFTGIAPYLRPYHQASGAPVHNFTSGKNMALRSRSMFWLNLHLRSANGGKGKNELQAKVGALGEAIERYSLMYQGPTYAVQSSMGELEDAIHPNVCMLFSETQYAQREDVNASATQFYSLVPVPFAAEEIMDWTPVYSLTNKQFKYLPSCFCFAQYPGRAENELYSYPDSNGCAAGNTLEEAILQGLLELIERDAAAIWWYNRLPRPGVDLDTADNAYIDQVRAYYEELGRSLYVLDLTTDLGIPVFAALSHRLDSDQPDEVLHAFGSHVDAGIALERSIIELNQLLPAAKKTREGYLTQDPVFVEWLKHTRLKDNPYLEPAPGSVKDMGRDYPVLCAATITDAVNHCVSVVEKVGMEVLVLDLTQPDIGLPVARVLVPGLRHFWRRTAPGRLYDVPVKMGWRDRPLTEAELNPIGIFI